MKQVKHFFTKSASQTKKFGKSFAKKIFKENLKRKRKALVLALQGELGSGKTTFLQGFARGLGIKEKILSPSFLIIKNFKIKNSKFTTFYHIDCYRLKKPKEILDLGYNKIISNPQNIVAVEWAGQIKKILPKEAIKIKFSFVNKNTRQIEIIIPKLISNTHQR